MKKLKIPHPKYDFFDQTFIKHTLASAWKSNQKDMQGFSLYGAYKLIRVMPTYAGLGDWVILYSCVDFLRKIDTPPTRQEIWRSMHYFQPALSIGTKRQLTETLFKKNL